MRVYKCLVSGDEMFNDSFPIEELEEMGLYKVKAKLVERKGDDVKLDGANPSAEDEEEQSETTGESGLDIVLDARLLDTAFSKKDYKTYLKDFCKRIIDHHTTAGKDTEFIDNVKAKFQKAAAFLLAEFKELVFYTGESMDNDGNIPAAIWTEEDIDGKKAPIAYFYFMKHALKDEKY